MGVIYSNIHEWEVITPGAKEEEKKKKQLVGQTCVFLVFILHKGLHLVCGFLSRKEKLQLTN